jgi:hypothetical protein
MDRADLCLPSCPFVTAVRSGFLPGPCPRSLKLRYVPIGIPILKPALVIVTNDGANHSGLFALSITSGQGADTCSG